MRALTRKPSDLSRCELTYLERRPIDRARALDQHARYEDLLRELGAAVISLPAEPELPDSVFVEDAAIVLEECAIVPHMGAPSRRLETQSLAVALSGHRPIFRLEPPGTLDGGDVLRVDRTLYVGQSTRTDARGIEALRRAVVPLGYEVLILPVHGCLHLKSACTLAGTHTLFLNPAWVDAAGCTGLEFLEVPPAEPCAANVLRVGDTVVVPAAFPRTARLLGAHGFAVRSIDTSELMKAEAGVTCMSLLFD